MRFFGGVSSHYYGGSAKGGIAKSCSGKRPSAPQQKGGIAMSSAYRSRDSRPIPSQSNSLPVSMSAARIRPQHDEMEVEPGPSVPGAIHWLKILKGTSNLMAGTTEHMKESVQSEAEDVLEQAKKDIQGLSKTYGQCDEDPLLSDILGSKTSPSAGSSKAGDPNDPRDRLAHFVRVCLVFWALLRRTPAGAVERGPSQEEVVMKVRGVEHDPKLLGGVARKLLKELKASEEGEMQRLTK